MKINLRDYLIKTCLANAKKVEAFIAYHRDNPQVWQGFEKITLDIIKRGRQGYGSMAILNLARWESDVRGSGDFKINNNHAPFFARIFMLKYPEHKDFFEFRELKQKAS